VAKTAPRRHPDGKTRLDAEDVGFQIAPRLNAAGRLGQPQLAVELLVTDRSDRARELAQYIDGLNATRQTLERSIQLAAAKQAKELFDPAEDAALVLADRGWHPGVIGIVAARISQEYFRPSLLVSVEGQRGRGSARSIPGVHICKALSQCAHCLIGYGGHEMAAGEEVDPGRIQALRIALNEAVGLAPEEMIPEIDVDAEIRLADLNMKILDELALLEPHGVGNRQPILSAENIDVIGEPRLLGSDGAHLSFHVRQSGATFRAIAFGKGGYYPQVARRGVRVSLLVEPQVSSWQGRSDIELNVREMRVV